jgi:hypothetical protein
MDAEGPEGLLKVQPDLERFLATFPGDARAEEFSGYQEELELLRRQKQFQARAKLRKGVEGLAPVERAYLEAVQLSTSHPEEALARFEAIVDVFRGATDPAESKLQQKASEQCVELAAKQIERLKETVATLNAEQRMALRRQLDRAGLLAGKDRAAADKIWSDIVTLYGDKAWAADLVAQAEAKLASTPPESPEGEREPSAP